MSKKTGIELLKDAERTLVALEDPTHAQIILRCEISDYLDVVLRRVERQRFDFGGES